MVEYSKTDKAESGWVGLVGKAPVVMERLSIPEESYLLAFSVISIAFGQVAHSDLNSATFAL